MPNTVYLKYLKEKGYCVLLRMHAYYCDGTFVNGFSFRGNNRCVYFYPLTVTLN